MDFNEHLDYLLLPPGKVKQIGAERGHEIEEGIARFVSPTGSNRFVMYEKGRALAALQVMDLKKIGQAGGHVANAFVAHDHRRKGLASKLFEEAKKHFSTLTLSDDLSGAGRKWKDKVLSQYAVMPMERLCEEASCSTA